ncbi:hypothetical protein TgHK011_000964 [Trichoderma gracile]|nr:hypothetical protein TgHK011_000964 [Trichoderma gracile]
MDTGGTRLGGSGRPAALRERLEPQMPLRNGAFVLVQGAAAGGWDRSRARRGGNGIGWSRPDVMPVLVLMLVLMQMPTRCSAGGVWRSVPGQAADGGWRRMYMYKYLVLCVNGAATQGLVWSWAC